MQNQTEDEHILELSKELLDDIELDRISSDKIIFKASRLARLAGSDEMRQWIYYEMQGYNSSEELSLRYMTLTGRWTDVSENKGYWSPIGQHEAHIAAAQSQIEASRISSVEGDWAFRVMSDNSRNVSKLRNTISSLAGVRSKVLGILHGFVSAIYYERQFSNLSESIFEGYKSDIDRLIAERAGEVMVKLPSVISRLKEGHEEATSQALSTCRRILECFADSIFPPSESTIEIGGNTLKLDASKHQNRINVFISQHTDSQSRKTRLRQNLNNLFDRVSTGVHKDVSPEEAYALFLNVYLFLGEVLKLEKEQPQAKLQKS